MTTLKFIKQVIDRLLATFTNLEECFYEYNDLTNTHFIKISSIIYDTKEFSNFDSEISLEFYNGNYEGVLCFITENSGTELKSPEYYINYFNNEILLKNLDFVFEDIGETMDEYYAELKSPDSSGEIGDSFEKGFEDQNYAMAA